MITRSRTTRLAATGLLLSYIVIAAVSPVQARNAPSRPLTPVEAQQVEGDGWLATATCIGCGGLLLASGATSILGALILAGTAPELVGGCIVACGIAFS
jgi:hypothetical protein